MRRTTRRHPARALASAVALTLAATAATAVIPATVASATTATDPALRGLYGTQDPTYDGVYRQGLAIIAIHAAGGTVDPTAIRWLRRQQCANGRWTSYRSDLQAPCGPGDSNATAMAVMALKTVGRDAAATRGVDWLVGKQAPGGGWEYSAGWGPDANSTGLVVQALIRMHIDPTTVRNDGSGLTFLRSVQLHCSALAKQRGALDYQAEQHKMANDYATAQATQALAGSALAVQPTAGSSDLPVMDCSGSGSHVTASAAAAGYLGRLLDANSGLVPSSFGTDPDYGSTANAVLSLVAAGYGSAQVTQAMTALEADVRAFVVDSSTDLRPAAAALLVLDEHATRGDPRSVGGINLVRRLERSITD